MSSLEEPLKEKLIQAGDHQRPYAGADHRSHINQIFPFYASKVIMSPLNCKVKMISQCLAIPVARPFARLPAQNTSLVLWCSRWYNNNVCRLPFLSGSLRA